MCLELYIYNKTAYMDVYLVKNTKNEFGMFFALFYKCANKTIIYKEEFGMSEYRELKEHVVRGDEGRVVSQIETMLNRDVNPLDIIQKGLVVGMGIVGDKFSIGEMFVPEVLMSARAMNAGMDLIKPHIDEKDIPNIGTAVIGTVKGDLHDIGKNLVTMMMETAVFKVINLGCDVPKDKFVSAAKENNADIVGMSAMLTTTMTYMDDIIEACKEAGIETQYMIGGAPITPEYANKIGAVYTADASSAANKAKELVE